MKYRFGQRISKPSPFNGFSKTDNERRSLWDALVDKGSPPYTKSTDPEPYYDPEKDRIILTGILDSMGRVPWDTSDQFLYLMDLQSQGRLKEFGIHEWSDYSRLKREMSLVAYDEIAQLFQG